MDKEEDFTETSITRQVQKNNREKAIFDVDYFINVQIGDYVQFDCEILYVSGEEYEDEKGKGMILERLSVEERNLIPKEKIKLAEEVIRKR